MFVVVFISLLAILLSLYQSRSNKNNHLFELGFCLLALIACIHYNYGTDYPNYYYLFNHDYNYSSFASVLANTEKEPGWAFINWILPKPYGFFILVALVSIIENYVFFKLIKLHIPTKLLWAATGLYVGITSFYLLNFSMLRQGVAIAIVVYSAICLDKRKWIQSVILVTIASTIHLSALVFVPFMLLFILPLKNGKPIVISVIVATIMLFLVQGLAGDLFASFAETDWSLAQYSLYQERIAADNASVGLGFLFNSVKYVVFFYFLLFKFDDFSHGEKVFLVLSCIPFCLVPFQLEVSGLVGRIGIYFSSFQIITIPITYSRIKSPFYKTAVIFLLLVMTFNAYYNFFMNSWATERYNIPFRTIFEVIF